MLEVGEPANKIENDPLADLPEVRKSTQQMVDVNREFVLIF